MKVLIFKYILVLDERYGNYRNGKERTILRVIQGELSELQAT